MASQTGRFRSFLDGLVEPQPADEALRTRLNRLPAAVEPAASVAQPGTKIPLRRQIDNYIALTKHGHVRRLFDSAKAHGSEARLHEGLGRTLVASVGPAVNGELASHGLRPDIVPAEDAYFMRPLISAMAAALAARRPKTATR